MDQEEISLETLKSAVKERGAKWTPEETTLTRLTTVERGQRLGLLFTEMETSIATKLGLASVESRSIYKVNEMYFGKVVGRTWRHSIHWKG